MIFKLLNSFSVDEILAVFNESFSDYIISVQRTKSQFADKLKAENISLDYSVAAVENDKLVGFILHGVSKDKKLAYNAGTGVIPSKRGQNTTAKMYDFILPKLRMDGFEQVVLEVISNNVPAMKSYEKVGFNQLRKLNCFKGEVKVTEINTDVIIKTLSQFDGEFANEHQSIKPSWQNANQAIRILNEGITAYGAFINDSLVGQVVVNKTNNRILQIVVDKAYRRSRIGASLLNHLKSISDSSSSIINVDSNSAAATRFFETHGYDNILQQYEMMLDL